MLLNQVRCSVGSSGFWGARDGFVVSRPRVARSVTTLQVRATTSEQQPSTGWLESVASKISQVGSRLEKKLQGADYVAQPTTFPSGDTITYVGTAVVMKKLQVLDILDRVADMQDDASEVFGGKHVSVQLISTETNPQTGEAFVSEEVIFQKWFTMFDKFAAEDLKFEVKFVVPKAFGKPGAIIVRNNHPNEFLLEKFTLDVPSDTTYYFYTNSWIYNTENGEGRTFFRSTAYLPDETPVTLKALRERELEELRGDGKGERLERDRIYDYDVYNDLGRPDDDPTLARPVLGGNPELPFPRRMRTGRPPSTTDANTETRRSKGAFYIPRDECFDRTKMSDFLADGVRSIGHSVSSKVSSLLTKKTEFDSLKEIKTLFAKKGHHVGGINNVLPEMADVPHDDQHPLVFLEEVLRPDGKAANPVLYPLPQVLHVDEHAWQSNDEFAREFLAGVNPVMIKLVTEFPLKSSLDPAVYGDPVSAISSEHVDGQLDGLSIEEALEKKRLFVVDYHDAYLPFVERINAQKGTATYATRALLFLRDDETLKTLALELVLPPGVSGGEKKKARVFTPPADSSKTDFLWECAKVHVQNNDIAAHQVFSHFTNCHAATEPVIIASNRQLSKLHPVYQLMAPHFKCTLEINRQARGSLISAGGSIEQHFTTGGFSMEMGGVHYRDTWTFESQALPVDLIRRGMAVADPSAKHGVKLVVEDYPYAADGLELWDAIKSWNSDYVELFYKEDGDVQKDGELMKWWEEIRTKAHADKKDAPGWPELNSRESLVEILTTLQWITSAQHAAVNFGQYDFVAFMPHHPTMTRRLVPEEGTPEWDEFQRNPEKFYLSSISNICSTTTAMSVYEVLSAHSPNEEYIGQRDPHWTECNNVRAALKSFCKKLGEVDRTINARNADPKLKNRLGVVQMPYQLLKPQSVPGVTSMGVPNSITI